MSKWIAEFELEDGDTMPEHMDLEYKGAKIDFYCRPMWISVNERLPEVGHRVIFSMKNDEIYIGALHTLDNDLKITLEPTGIRYVYSFENVTAWMPLPEPYKGGEQDG